MGSSWGGGVEMRMGWKTKASEEAGAKPVSTGAARAVDPIGTKACEKDGVAVALGLSEKVNGAEESKFPNKVDVVSRTSTAGFGCSKMSFS